MRHRVAVVVGTSRHNVRRYLRAARNQKDWTQAQLASAAEISRNTVVAVEGGTTASVDSETSIEVALGLPIGSIDRVRHGMTAPLPDGTPFQPIIQPDTKPEPVREPTLRERKQQLVARLGELIAEIQEIEREIEQLPEQGKGA